MNLGSAIGEYWAFLDDVFMTLTGMIFTFEIYGNLSFLD